VAQDSAQSFANSRDQQYVSNVADAQQRVVIADSLARHRHADSLHVGDVVPALLLTRLTDGHVVRLSELAGARPLMLIFGSYT
jgi:hypothetical protein